MPFKKPSKDMLKESQTLPGPQRTYLFGVPSYDFFIYVRKEGRIFGGSGKPLQHPAKVQVTSRETPSIVGGAVSYNAAPNSPRYISI